MSPQSGSVIVKPIKFIGAALNALIATLVSSGVVARYVLLSGQLD